MLLNVAFSLLMFSMLEVVSIEGVIGPCSVPLENIAVYEGDQTTVVSYPAGTTRVKWTTLATTDELTPANIVDYDSVVHSAYASDFVMSTTGLAFMNATTIAGPGHELSTAGLYTAECGGSEMSFKLLVVRSGPTCSCKPVGSSKVQLTCSTIYADSTYDPIAAIFTFYVGGKRMNSDTPERTNYDGYTWLSTSTFTADYGSASTYECRQTFGIPTEVQDPNVAMNAPKFNHNCSVRADACGLTTTVPKKETTQPPSVTTACSCELTNTCPPSVAACQRASECQSDGTDMTYIYTESVVNAQKYVRTDKCCLGSEICGVVVTLRNDSRWLIHDSLRVDNKCSMTVVNASCMSTDWSPMSNTIVKNSVVDDYVKKGNIGLVDQITASCIDSCTRMMNLP